jgi:hypothetical protein
LARQGQELARQSKQADLLSEFNRRYTQVLEMQQKPEHQHDPTLYYDRLWNLMGIDQRVLTGVWFPARDADYRVAGR